LFVHEHRDASLAQPRVSIESRMLFITEFVTMFRFNGRSEIVETEDTVTVTKQQRSCLTTRALLGYLFNVVPVEDRAAVESHLSSCPKCQQTLEGLQTGVDRFVAKRGLATIRKRGVTPVKSRT
jgi:Putative zinc-finger